MYSLSTSHERRLLWLLMLTQFTNIMDFMVVMPLGPQIIAAFHISPAAFAAAVSAYSICGGISGLLAATYIDRFDRRQLMLVVYALFALSNLICALADSYLTLLIARAFAGVSGGVLSSMVMAIIADVIPASRRGAATGTVMTAFSVASVIGVPVGVLLGAHFQWTAPFWLLVTMSSLVWFGAWHILPALNLHLTGKPVPIAQILPNLLKVFTNSRYQNAFVLTFMAMISTMLVIPFISPTLVANLGVKPEQLSWLYMAGGSATFFSAQAIGRLADRYGKRHVFRMLVLLSLMPILLITHMPAVSYLGLLMMFPFFMVLVSGRIVPMQALISTIPEATERGAFLSVNNAIQSLGTGIGAWIGGLMLSTDVHGHIGGYGNVGWLATVIAIGSVFWVARIRTEEDCPTPEVVPTLTEN